jgi:hypothetical protein
MVVVAVPGTAFLALPSRMPLYAADCHVGTMPSQSRSAFPSSSGSQRDVDGDPSRLVAIRDPLY